MIIAIALLAVSILLFLYGCKAYLDKKASAIKKLYGLVFMLVLPVDILHQNVLLPLLNWPQGMNWFWANLIRLSVPYLPTILLLLFVRFVVVNFNRPEPIDDHK